MRCLALLLLLSCTTLPATQMVANGGFENLISTSTSLYPGGIGNAANWVSGGGSPDFHSNSTILFYGYSSAQSCYAGLACAGILNAPPAINNNTSVQYEYLQTQLLSDMVAGETYQVSMMAAFSDRARVSTPDLGIHLSTGTSFDQPTDASWLPIHMTPTFNNPTGNLITSTAWLAYQTSYVANGGERYLTIGNFSQNPGFFAPTFSGPNFSSGYFFIDNVSVLGGETVPEPSTVGMAIAALVLIALLDRRDSFCSHDKSVGR